jgi:hypothetical protein
MIWIYPPMNCGLLGIKPDHHTKSGMEVRNRSVSLTEREARLSRYLAQLTTQKGEKTAPIPGNEVGRYRRQGDGLSGLAVGSDRKQRAKFGDNFRLLTNEEILCCSFSPVTGGVPGQFSG